MQIVIKTDKSSPDNRKFEFDVKLSDLRQFDKICNNMREKLSIYDYNDRVEETYYDITTNKNSQP